MADVREPEKTHKNDAEKSVRNELPVGDETQTSNNESSSEGGDPKDEYPMGLTLWLLVGSVMMAIFLIALDQVCSLFVLVCCQDLVPTK